MQRKPRSSEARDAVGRAAESRPVPKVNHQSRFYIPPHLIPKGMTYAWVAFAFDNAGTPNQENWQVKYRNGWRPVPRSRHPELFPPVPNIGFGNDDDTTIKQGGQILCEKPTPDVNDDKKANLARAKAQLDGVSWMQSSGQNPFMPRFDESKTEFGHATEFKE